MTPTNSPSPSTLARDLTAGLVVFLVALPLCLGVALASDAPLLSGVLAGVVGGILVGLLSGSHTSVSGPSPGADGRRRRPDRRRSARSRRSCWPWSWPA